MILGGLGLHFALWTNFFLLPQAAGPEDDLRPTVVDAPIHAMHTPSGFDDNDVAQIIIEGEFPNTCYAVGRAIVRAQLEDLEQGVIKVHLEALHSKRGNCLQVETPFIKVVDLGVLPAGKYSILGLKTLNKMGTLNIAHAGEAELMDKHNYAPVDALYIRDDALGFRRMLVLIGAFSNTCVQFAETTPLYRGTADREVLEVLPIVEMRKDSDCREAHVPFFKTIEIPDGIPSGRYLFHVRTANGNSLNKMDRIKME